MKELSIFVDESGDFGSYAPHSPFYIIALVFHDQAENIGSNIDKLGERLSYFGLTDDTVHTGPLIRKENEYRNMPLEERKRIFNALYNFTRTSAISYRAIHVEKRQLVDAIDLHIQITKRLSDFLRDKADELLQYGRIVVYYDNGQVELTKILVSVFGTALSNVEFKKVVPANYRLFQAADLLCTLELLSLKAERKMLTKSELLFFSSGRDLHKSFTKSIHRKLY